MQTIKADLLVRNARVFNSYFKKFVDAHVAVLDGKIYYVDERRDGTYDAAAEVDAAGMHMVPGLIDIHMHIESSMMTPPVFCNYVGRLGVTTIVSEPHEMGNVFGIDGVLAMIRAGEGSPIDVFYGISSCVPSSGAHLETTGGEITCADMEELMKNPAVICVGEVMNYRRIIDENERETLDIYQFIKKLRAHDRAFPIEAHCPALVDLDLAKFLFLGISGDHTEHTIEELRQRFANGMFVEIQEKMLKPEVFDFIAEHNLYEHFCFVTDDAMADRLCSEGQLDLIVRKAMALGLAPEHAIYNATYTAARRMNLLDRGTLAPGFLADFALLDDLTNFSVAATYKNGKAIYRKGETLPAIPYRDYFPGPYRQSIRLSPPTEDDFVVRAPAGTDEVRVRAMVVSDGSTQIAERIVTMPVQNGVVQWQDSGYLLAAVFERYGKNGNIALGFLGGACHKRGAVATSYAHDCHNVLVAGANVPDMLLAVRRLIAMQGGMVATEDGEVKAELQLDIGGIISDRPIEETSEGLRRVRAAMIAQGYAHYNPIMSYCTVTLPVAPALKMTDVGLIDVIGARVVPLIVD